MESNFKSYPTWPCYSQQEATAVHDVLLSNQVNYWTGEQGKQFEKEFAAAVGCEYAIALANGSVALELALRALGIGPGHEVVVTPRSFVASASAVVNVGATPIFADVDRDSQNITAESVRAVLTEQCKAIICVHLAGWPCDMDAIMQLADAKGLWVVEDCAQAHGARYKGRSVGGLGHVAAWSFCQDKIMTTGGEGGMLTTSSEDFWARAWAYKEHGKSWAAVHQREHSAGFRWVHESFGTNWRMTEMQAAIGRIQLEKLPDWIACRNRNASLLSDALDAVDGLRVVRPPQNIGHAYYKYYLFVEAEYLAFGWSRDRIMQALSDQGIPCSVGSCPEIYREKAFVDAHLMPEERLIHAKLLAESSLMLEVHPTLSPSHMQKIAQKIQNVMDQATVQ